MSAAPSTPFPAVPERIAEIIYVLCQTLTARLRAATLSHAQLTYIVGRLLGIRKRFRGLVERIRVGKPPRERTRRARASVLVPEPEFRPPPPGWRRWAVRAQKPVPAWRLLRPGFGWLLPLAAAVPGFHGSAAEHRAHLLGLLAEPEIQVLLLASRRVGDSLRPLCWMLGIETSVLYPARPATVLSADPSCSAPGPDVFAVAPVSGDRVASGNVRGVVAAPAPNVVDVIEPPGAWPRAREGGDFFAIA